MSYQKTTLVGYVGSIDIFQNGDKQVVKTSICTTDKYKGEYRNTWHNNVKAFGKIADVLAKHLKKHDAVIVECTLSYGSYEKNVGNEVVKIPTTDLIITDFTWQNLPNSKNTDDSATNENNQQQQSANTAQTAQQQHAQRPPQHAQKPARQPAQQQQAQAPQQRNVVAAPGGGDFDWDDNTPLDLKGRGSLSYAL